MSENSKRDPSSQHHETSLFNDYSERKEILDSENSRALQLSGLRMEGDLLVFEEDLSEEIKD